MNKDTARTVWITLLLGWAQLCDWLPWWTPKERWGISMSGQALFAMVACWMLRGPKAGILWFVCMWGMLEFGMTAVCQFTSVWWPVKDPRGACTHYIGFDIGPIEVLMFSLILWGLVKCVERRGP